MHNAVPLEQRFVRFLTPWEKRDGLLNVPWGDYRFHFPAAWLRTSGATIYKGPVATNPEFFSLLVPILKRKNLGTIVDVGANVGIYVLNVRSFCSAPIIAYEPAPFVFDLLLQNVRANQLKDVDVRNIGCGAVRSEVLMNAGVNSYINEKGSTYWSSRRNLDGANAFGARVREYQAGNVSELASLVKLDDDLSSVPSIGLVKIDCEGFEYQVLSGAQKILTQHRPFLFVELHPSLISRYGHSLQEICDLLRPDYEMEFWDFGISQRSPNALIRFLGRYTRDFERLPSEASMLERVATNPQPSQLFLLARPR